MPKFEIFKSVDGYFYFRLKAENGEIVACSEGYTRKEKALEGINSIRRIAGEAGVVDTTRFGEVPGDLESIE
jgi:uncharacterized protein YegP (UPF0339 family)